MRSDFVSAGFGATVVSQPLAPIGTPAIKTDALADLRTQGVKYIHSPNEFNVHLKNMHTDC